MQKVKMVSLKVYEFEKRDLYLLIAFSACQYSIAADLDPKEGFQTM